MDYIIKIQKVDRGNTKSFYVNFPAAVAEASNIKKGEEMECLPSQRHGVIEDRNTFVLKRIKPTKTVLKKK